jgi:23S rRNA (guanosine2251-2'-O)-methyltransferase
MSDKYDFKQNEQEFIFGRNVVLSFLEQANQKEVILVNSAPELDKIFLAQGLQYDRRIDKIKLLAREQSVPVVVSEKQQLDKLVGMEARHQGIVARLSQTKTLTLSEFLNSLSDSVNGEVKIPNMLIAIADGIQDPHNLGALMRVAQASGAKGLITSHRRSAGTTGTVAKASAGAMAFLPIVKVKNIVSAIEELKKFGFWIAGLDAEGKENFFAHDLRLPLAIVVGGEGKGLSRLVSEHCDFLLRIPMAANSESLNAAVAAGVVFYEYVRQNLCEEK